MVYITGDCHADFSKFTKKHFPEQKSMSRDDIAIVCGDFGIWHDDNEERGRLKELSERQFTIAFVDGNHENFDRLYSDEFPIVDFHGGKAHQIRENVYHLIRGNIFDFEGKKFFAFGGAQSHDIRDGVLDSDDFHSDDEFQNTIHRWNKLGRSFWINHVSWWKEELPSREEMDFGLKNLKEYGNSVDYVITHCCPQEIASINGYRNPDKLTMYFNEIARTIKFDKWFFGHYHRECIAYSVFVMLYESLVRLL